jgi:hypothetical protein
MWAWLAIFAGGVLAGYFVWRFTTRSGKAHSARLLERSQRAVGSLQDIRVTQELRRRALENEALTRNAGESLICPKCGSESVGVGRRGFSAGKAALGALTAGGVLLGAVGAGKVENACGHCGHRWSPSS